MQPKNPFAAVPGATTFVILLAAILIGSLLGAALALIRSALVQPSPHSAPSAASIAQISKTPDPAESLPSPSTHPISSTATQTPSPTSTITFLPTVTGTATPTRTPTATPWTNPYVIGYSVEGHPLEVYRFGEGPVERLIVAGIHGGYEWNTIQLAQELMTYLENHPEMVPVKISLYILPSMNPDGAERGHGAAGRANSNSVDLNRNFPTFWQADYPRSGCWQQGYITTGIEPLSEPESAALARFIEGHSFDAMISYHSAAPGIFAGGLPPDAGSIHLAQTLAQVSGYPFPPIDTGCLYTGQLIDWASSQGVASVDIELTTHWNTDWDVNLKILEAFLSWIRPAEATPIGQ